MESDRKRIKTRPNKPGEERILKVTGTANTPLFLGLDDLSALEVKEMVDISIKSGCGNPQGHIRISRGVLLENVIRMAGGREEKTDDAKKMFIIASADDGRKAVFSWQEVCHTSAGNGVMIVLDKDDNRLDHPHNRLRLISTRDYLADSRHVRGLRSIEVVRTR